MRALPTLPRSQVLAVTEATRLLRERLFDYLHTLQQQGVGTVTAEVRL